MKTIRLLLICMLLCSFTLGAVAQEMETELVMHATVEGKEEIALQAPASGLLAPFALNLGELIKSNATIFSIEPKIVYAPINGEVTSILINHGSDLAAAEVRYGSAMQISYENSYILNAHTAQGHYSEENRDLHQGMTVYLRDRDKEQFATGRITNFDNGAYTVEIINNEFEYFDYVKIYRDAEYSSSALIGEDSPIRIEPYAINVQQGTVKEVFVKEGDIVKLGDPLFSYVPDALPINQVPEGEISVVALEDYILSSVSVAQGANVAKDQVLATVYKVNDFQLVASIEENELSQVKIGDTFKVSFDAFKDKEVEATVSNISYVGKEQGERVIYPVYLTFEVFEGVGIGMSATVTK